MMIFFIVFQALSTWALTIEEICTLAFENSSSLKAKEMEQRALISESQWRSRWSNPQLMGQFGTLRSGEQNGPTMEVSVLQAIPLSDKYSLKKEIVSEALAAQEKRTEAFKNFVIHQALLAAWRAYSQQKLVEHGTERNRRIKLIKRYMESRPKASIRQQVELNVLSALLMNHEKLLDQKVFDLSIALSELEYWIGVRIDPRKLEFTIPKIGPLVPPAVSVTKDPELLDAESVLRTSQFEFELAKKEQRPDLLLGAGYRVEKVEPVNRFSYATIGVNIPIWDTGKDRAEMARARAMRDERELEDTKKRAFSKQQKQLENVLFSAKQVERFSLRNLPIQEHAVNVAEEGFKKGLIDVNLFLQSETQSHEAIDQIFESWVAYLENLSLLQLMRGEAFTWETL